MDVGVWMMTSGGWCRSVAPFSLCPVLKAKLEVGNTSEMTIVRCMCVNHIHTEK